MYNKPLKNYEAVKIPYRSQQNVSNLHSCKPSIHHSAPVCTQANKSLGIIQQGPESDLQYIIAPELHSNLHKRLFLFQITKSKAVLISFQSRECEEWLNECYNSTYYRLESITEENRGEKKGTHDTPCLEVINSNPEAPAFLSPFILSPTKLGADCAEGHKKREARRTVRQTRVFLLKL